MEKFHLEKHWDIEKVCKNPHKGWYFHYFDNAITKYQDKHPKGDYLLDFPGMNHIYLRLAWSYLEPEAGVYNWQLIDEVIDAWRAHGYTISFRISCKETAADQEFATPEWVKDLGCKGTFYPNPEGGQNWEPDYGDPIFLARLEQFHKVFAERYDKDWVEYVDIGSYGEWGEGHTTRSGKKHWPVYVIKQHIDIHCRHYRNTHLVVSKGIITSRKDSEENREEILNYIRERGVTLRSDSICVKGFADLWGLSTLRCPEYYELFWPEKPVVLELEHYHKTQTFDTWKEGVPLVAAVKEMHATFVGFHGYPREWLADNPEVARELANLAGYWYFLKSVEIPTEVATGSVLPIKLVWENHGVAPAYHHYPLTVRITKDGQVVAQHTAREVDNRQWTPGCIRLEKVTLNVPSQVAPGEYTLEVGLHQHDQPIELGFRDSLRTDDGFYRIADVSIT